MARVDGGLRQLFRQHLPKMHWQSIEVAAIAKGVPDCNCCYQGVEFWVENKRSNAYTIGLRPEQVAWLDRRARNGGTVFIAVRRITKRGPRRGAAADELWLLDGRAARAIGRLNSLQMVRAIRPELVLCVEEGGPTRWQWSSVGAALVRKRILPSLEISRHSDHSSESV